MKTIYKYLAILFWGLLAPLPLYVLWFEFYIFQDVFNGPGWKVIPTFLTVIASLFLSSLFVIYFVVDKLVAHFQPELNNTIRRH